MINTQPLASIALICYNQEKTIQEALESLFFQDYCNFEIIISDDCSQDNTVEIIKSFIANHPRQQVTKININEQNLGIGGNLAKAVSLCSGDFIIPASGDDISEKTRVSTLIDAWINSGKSLCYINTDVTDIAANGSILKTYRADNFKNYTTLASWLKKPQFFVGTESWSSDFYKQFKPPINVRAEDQIMSFRAILLGCGITIHKSLLYHRLGGVTDKKPKTFKAKIDTLRKEALYSKADYTQLWLDAVSVGKQSEVEQFLQSKIAESELVIKCFNEKSKLKVLKFLFTHKNVKYLKKIRYFTYLFLPAFHRLIYKIKSQSK